MLREKVADRGPERAREDVRNPESADGVEGESVMRDRDCRDRPGEDQCRHPVAEVETLGREIAGCGTECEREQHGEPVERLATRRVDRVDRKCPLAQPPDGKHDGEHDAEDRRGRHERNAGVIGQVVRDLRSDHADQHDSEPVDAGDVPPRAELEDERRDEECGRDVRRVRQAKADVVREVVGCRLSHRGAQHLDHPEVESYLGHFVQHAAGRISTGLGHRPSEATAV